MFTFTLAPNRTLRAAMPAVTAFLGLSLSAAALDAVVNVSPPKSGGHVVLRVEDARGAVLGQALVPLAYAPDMPGQVMSAVAKMQQIGPLIQGALPQFTPNFAGDQLALHNLPAGAHVSFSGGTTGELDDSILAGPDSAPTIGRAIFEGGFPPMDVRGQPAIFSAGIVTDVGVLNERISAQELNFQTDGPIICQALFQRLAPRAPQYGAQINYAGDRLEIYFDPAYTVTQGGIIFGTTSQGQGSRGEVELQPAPPAGLPADLNCDGIVSVADIGPFVLALTDFAGYIDVYPLCDIFNGDMNNDGMISVSDIGPFVSALTGQ